MEVHRFDSLGDTHRFGQYVKRARKINGVKHIFKPRPVFFEELLLTNKFPEASKLRGFLGLKKINLSSINKGTWSSLIEDISYLKVEDPNKIDKYSYSVFSAKLLAFAVMSGCIDLHFENIFICFIQGNYIPVPVDIEIMWFHLLSGADTHLIPSSITDSEKCGLAGQFQKVEFICGTVLLEWFLKSTNELLSNYDDYFYEINKLSRKKVVRLLLRPTKLYRDFLDGKSIIDSFLDEEIIQLENYDIPYFFFHYNSSKAQFFDTPNSFKLANLDKFESYFNTANKAYKSCSDKDYLRNLTQVTSLQIIRAFENDFMCGRKSDYFEVRIEKDSIMLITENFSVSCEKD